MMSQVQVGEKFLESMTMLRYLLVKISKTFRGMNISDRDLYDVLKRHKNLPCCGSSTGILEPMIEGSNLISAHSTTTSKINWDGLRAVKIICKPKRKLPDEIIKFK